MIRTGWPALIADVEEAGLRGAAASGCLALGCRTGVGFWFDGRCGATAGRWQWIRLELTHELADGTVRYACLMAWDDRLPRGGGRRRMLAGLVSCIEASYPAHHEGTA